MSGIAQRRARRRDAKPRRSDQRLDDILAGAARVFRERGYAHTTLEDVAREVGINRATLYYYVADKEELLVEVVREPVAQWTRDLREIKALDAEPQEKLRLVAQKHAQAFADNYPHLFVFLGENLHRLQPRHDELQRNSQEYGDLLTEIIADGVEQGQFRADLDPHLSMLGLIGMWNWTHRWYSEDGPNTLEEICTAFVELFLDGIMAAGVERPSARRLRTQASGQL